MNKVKAIMVGMSRAGTTFMYHNLQKHPGLFLATRKEICYFAHNFDRGLNWYHNFFKEQTNNQISIDICGVYFTDDEALNRIKDYGNDVKIILCIRDPHDWIYSFYEQYSGNFDMPGFSDFIKYGHTITREGKTVHLDFNHQKIKQTIERYKNAFSGRLLLYDFSLFKQNPLKVLKEIESFIGVEPWFKEYNFTNARINASGRNRNQFFDKFLHKKGVIDIILKLLPRSLILKLRNRRDKLESQKIAPIHLQEKYSHEQHELVQKIFEQDKLYIEELFKDKPVLKI